MLYPFTDVQQSKIRPGLVLLDSGDADILVARVVTKGPVAAYDVPLADWARSGLRAASTVRLHKLNALGKNLVRQRIGMIQPADRQRVADVLRQMFGNW
jgi:mRNA interferase MazF